MRNNYIENLKVLAGVHSGFVSEQNIKLLCLKYNLTDDEMSEMFTYCREHGITIYDDEKEDPFSENQDIRTPSKSVAPETEEQKQYNQLIRKVSRRIMHFASVKAMKRVGGPLHGWICGTYASSIERIVAKQVKHTFTRDQIQFIIDHMPTTIEEDEAESFSLMDDNYQELCNELNARLNDLIPRLHVNKLFVIEE